MKVGCFRRNSSLLVLFSTGLFLFCLVFSAAAAILPTTNVINPTIVVPPVIPNLTGTDNPDYQYSIVNSKAKITQYTGDDSDIIIPSKLGGFPVTVIGPNAFQSVPMFHSVVIPEGVTELQMAAFGFNPNLKSVTLPSTLEVIGEDAFANSTSLTEINFPENLRSISYSAFYNSALTFVNIPAKVTAIDSTAFWNCSKLTGFSVDSQNSVYSSNNGVLYKNGNILVSVPQTFSGVTIPAFVQEIGPGAFRGNELITSITIPNTVKKIGDGAFIYCSKLQSIVIPSSVLTVDSGAFYDCKSLAAAEFQGASTQLGRDLFSGCSALSNVKLPANLNKIAINSFYGCYSLKNIEIPAGVTLIEDVAFGDCINLAQVKMPASLKTINANAFRGCKNLPAITLPEGVTTINNRAFSECSNLRSITIPGQVTQIGARAFYGCTNLQAARFYGNAPQIGTELFKQTASAFKIYYINGKSGWTSPTWNNYPAEGVASLSLLPIIPAGTIVNFPLPAPPLPRLTIPVDKINLPDFTQTIAPEDIELLPVPIVPPVLIQPVPTLPGPVGSKELLFYVGQLNYSINAQTSTMDTSPLIKDSRVLLPVRYVADPLGAVTQWNPAEQKVTVTSDQVVLELWIGKNTAVVNGVEKIIDENNPEVQPIIVPPGRTMLPLRFISEQLGCDVKWVPELKQVKITYPKATDYLDPQPEPPM